MAEEKKEATPATTAVPEAPAVSQGKAAEPRITSTVGTSGTPSSGGGGGPFDGGMLPFLIGGMLLMYLLIIRPEKKRREAQLATQSALKKGDEVVLSGIGMYGTIASIDGDDVMLFIDSKKEVKIKVLQGSHCCDDC